jgi:hypothetical protein
MTGFFFVPASSKGKPKISKISSDNRVGPYSEQVTQTGKGDTTMQSMKRPRFLGLAFGLVIGLVASLALGQDVFIYPTQGQSPEQQNRDRYECHTWAVQQTGYDPSKGQASAAPPPPPAGGGAVRGATRGAAVGAIGGAIAGDAGKGAAIGAATGGLLGGMRRQEQYRQQQQAQANQAAQQQAARSNYNRALAACLSGRGYTVQ